jgi:hypothetical protein
LRGDAIALRVSAYVFDHDDPAVHQGPNYFHYVTSTHDFFRLLRKAADKEKKHDAARSTRRQDEHRERIEVFRTRCSQALAAPEGEDLLDIYHFQAQWCDRCALGGLAPCELKERPAGKAYGFHPEFVCWAEINTYEDNDGENYKRVDRVVPRCELFRLGCELSIHRTGRITFATQKRERRDTVIRWLDTMLRPLSVYGWSRGLWSPGLWSPLRWLPYARDEGKDYDRTNLLRYVLDVWDDMGDARIATLITTLASEVAALTGRGSALTVYNPRAGYDESWYPFYWKYLVEGCEPMDWRDDVEWPFAAEED